MKTIHELISLSKKLRLVRHVSAINSIIDELIKDESTPFEFDSKELLDVGAECTKGNSSKINEASFLAGELVKSITGIDPKNHYGLFNKNGVLVSVVFGHEVYKDETILHYSLCAKRHLILKNKSELTRATVDAFDTYAIGCYVNLYTDAIKKYGVYREMTKEEFNTTVPT